MNRQVDTIKIGGGSEYAKVAERLKLFREDRPNGKIETDKGLRDDGSYEFTAWVWKDKTEYLEVLKSIGNAKEARGSADATANAKGFLKSNKDYEKLETIAIGRALAFLGYAASGDVASYEEMEEFYKQKEEEKQQYILDQIALFEQAKTMEELRELWSATNKAIPEIYNAKESRKAFLELKNDN
jgi:hypothetical protein